VDPIILKDRFAQSSEPAGISLNFIKSTLAKNWHWFAILGFIGLVGGYAYNKVVLPYYRISTTVLVLDDSKKDNLNNIYRQLSTMQDNASTQDEVGVLQSYNLNLQTIKYFNWRYSWFQKRVIGKKDLYKNDPFILTTPTEAAQLENVLLTIKLISPNKYQVLCDETVKIGGIKTEIYFESEVALGETFKNKYFQFTLSVKDGILPPIGEEYILMFNNLSKMAMAYKEKLIVKANSGASPTENSNMITLELKTNQLERDVDFLEQLSKMYIQYGLEKKNRQASNTINFIDNQIAGVNSSLQNAGNTFTNFRAENRTVDLGREASVVVEKLRQVEADRANLDLRLESYNNLKYYLENRDQNKDLVFPSIEQLKDPALIETVKKLNVQYSNREVLSYTVQEKNPVLVSLNNEIRFTQKSLLENIESLISNAKLEQKTLDEQQNKINYELSKLPKTEQNLIGIKRNFDLNNELYTFLLQRRAEAEITRASNTPDAQVLDPVDKDIAVLIGPLLWLNIFFGFFGGLFGALGLIVVKEVLSDVLNDSEEITKMLDVAVIGLIAKNRYKTERPTLEYPRSSIAESFRGIRGNLEFLFTDSPRKVLAVHSYISGEGKSFVAFNIALIFAMNNKKVLIVDGDLRKPRLHSILRQDNAIGLSLFLERKVELKDIIRKTDVPNLSFVSSGPILSDSSELLNTNAIRDFVQAVREQFDFIIFDNAPIGVVYDGSLIGRHADINLILLRLNYSRKKEIAAINKIGHDGILKHVAVILNEVKQTESYGYYTEEGKSKKTKPKRIRQS
jgi:capsular exopolysaccharide synthesis family protein